MSDSRKRRGSAALPSHMRYARPRHNPADQGSLVKAISAAMVLAAASKGHPHCCNIGSTYRPWQREFCGFDAFTAVHIGVGKRGAYLLVHGDMPRQHSFGTTLRFTGPVLADSRQ